VPIFLERFILPMLATGVIAVIVLNPFKFDWHQRAGLLLVVAGLAYFVARTVQLENRPSPPQSKSEESGGSSTGPASTSGPNSPATTGNGNKIEYGAPAESPGEDKR
jgi:hypothetical protein